MSNIGGKQRTKLVSSVSTHVSLLRGSLFHTTAEVGQTTSIVKVYEDRIDKSIVNARNSLQQDFENPP